MKISDLPASKAGLIGSRVPGMKNLSSYGSFPELVLKRANDVRSAVQYGGIMVELTEGRAIFFACQDPEQLLDTELTLPQAASIRAKLGSPFYTRDDGLSFFRVSLTGGEDSTVNPTVVPEGWVIRWCAVLTPCAGYGHSGIGRSNYTVQNLDGLSMSTGPITEGGSVAWGTTASQVETGGAAGSALVLWREVPLRKTLGEIARRPGFFDDLVQAYPEALRDNARATAADAIAELKAVPVCQLFSYTRGVGETDGHFGIGIANPFAYSTGARGAKTALQVYGSRGLPASGSAANGDYNVITDFTFDCGFRSVAPNGTRQWNRLSTPRPMYGWKVENGAIPNFVLIDDTRVNTEALLRDFLPLATSAALSLRMSGATVHAYEVPAIAWGKDTENEAGEKAVGTVVTQEPTSSEDYLVHVINVLARVDAELGGGDTFHRTSTRVWEASAAERASYLKPVRYLLQFPGSTWNGASKTGGQCEFTSAGELSLKKRTVRYAGVTYVVIDVFADGKFFRSYAETAAGASLGESSAGGVRGVTTVDGRAYGAASTSSAAPGPGALIRVQDGKRTVVAEL